MRTYMKFIAYLVLVAWVSMASADPVVDFFRAVNADDERSVKTLLAAGFDPNTPDPQGQVGLYLAMRDEASKVATALIAHPTLKIDATNAAGETALMMAALRGNLDWTRRLLERGAAINRAGWSPLHYAASGPGLAVVKFLVERGAEINAPSPNRSTPLMMASRYGAWDSADWLLDRGADARLLNDRSLGAVDFARTAGRDGLVRRIEQLTR